MIPDFTRIPLGEPAVGAVSPPAGPAERWQTPEGIGVKAVYTAADLDGVPFLDSLPGIAPYLRGCRPTASAPAAPARPGLSVTVDLATRHGYDSDDPRAAGTVGAGGAAVDSLQDMRELLAGTPLDRSGVVLPMTGAVLPLLALHLLAAEERGVAPGRLSGTLRADVRHPRELAPRIVADVLGHLPATLPGFGTVVISGTQLSGSGAGADLELAYTLAAGAGFLRAGRAAGLDADTLAPRLSFFWVTGMTFFMELAKLRAGRLLWSRIVRDAGARDPEALKARIDCRTSGRSPQGYHDVVRGCLRTMAATQGHAASPHTDPDAGPARSTARTRVLLRAESGTAQVTDPWGGSAYLERLTHDLAGRAWARLREAATTGVPAPAGTVTGMAGDPAVLAAQRHRLRRLRADRDQPACDTALAALARAVTDPRADLLALSVTAARAHATLGEMTRALAQA